MKLESSGQKHDKISSSSKRILLHLALATTKKGDIILGRALWVLEATHSKFINGLYTEQYKKLPLGGREAHATV